MRALANEMVLSGTSPHGTSVDARRLRCLLLRYLASSADRGILDIKLALLIYKQVVYFQVLFTRLWNITECSVLAIS